MFFVAVGTFCPAPFVRPLMTRALWPESWTRPPWRKRAPTRVSGSGDFPVGECRRDAFEAMARRFEADLFRAARRLCGSRPGVADEIADLVQETLVRAYRALLAGQYDGDLRADPSDETESRRQRAWLLRILTNGFLNDYRRRRRWDSGVTVDALTAGGESAGRIEWRASSGETPEGALLESVLDPPLEAALDALPDGMRACVVLVEIEELSYAEAADALSIPIGTVRSRLARARLLLQKSLVQYDNTRSPRARSPRPRSLPDA